MKDIEKHKDTIRASLLERNLTLVFIRHGVTDWSEALLKQGPQDLPLNGLGIQQTMKMANKVSEKFQPATIYTSPLKRAKESATIHSKKHNADLIEIKDLQERYFGDYRLLSDKEIETRATPPDMELDEEFNSRVMLAFIDIIKQHPDSTPIMVVSHEKVFQFISSVILGKSEKLSYSEVAILAPNGKEFSMDKYTTDSLTSAEQAEQAEQANSGIKHSSKRPRPWA